MIILIDMDDVLADFDGEFYRRWLKIHPDKPLTHPGERKSFYVKDDSPENYYPLITEINTAPGFVRNLPLIEGGKEAINEMKDSGHTLFICTSPLLKFQNCVKEKYEWVDEHLGPEWVKRLILTRDKTLVRGDYIIDDKPEISGNVNPVWEHILYDKPYNRNITWKKRLTWDNWREVIEAEDSYRR